AALGRERIPASARLAELADQVVHVDEEVLVEERVGARGPVHVVARLRLGLGGDLRRHLQVRHGIHAHRAVVGVAERLRLLAELVVGGRDEVVPAEEGQLSLLSVCGRLAESEPGGHPGRGAGGGTEESTSRNATRSDLVHGGPPYRSGGLGAISRTLARWFHPLVSEESIGKLLTSSRGVLPCPPPLIQLGPGRVLFRMLPAGPAVYLSTASVLGSKK